MILGSKILLIIAMNNRFYFFNIIQLLCVLTGVQSRVLLHVRQLLETPIAIGTFVWFLAGVHPNVLHQLMIAAETLQALLALVRLHVRTANAAERRRQSANAAAAADAAAVVVRAGARYAAAASLEIASVLHLHGALVHEDLRVVCGKGVEKQTEEGWGGGWICD